jgi:hypothetical protein
MVRRMVDAFKKGIEEDKDSSKEPEERVRETITMNPRRRDTSANTRALGCQGSQRIWN